MREQPKGHGPWSYVPAIEAKYGKTIDEWRTLVDAEDLPQHDELVTWLEVTHGMGHGHATALAADRKARLAGR